MMSKPTVGEVVFFFFLQSVAGGHSRVPFAQSELSCCFNLAIMNPHMERLATLRCSKRIRRIFFSVVRCRVARASGSILLMKNGGYCTALQYRSLGPFVFLRRTMM